MDIEGEILARVNAAKLWDASASLSDFQLNATEAGFVLKSLRTGQPQFIFDTSWLDELISNAEAYSSHPLRHG